MKKVLRIITTIIAIMFLIIFILPISSGILNIGNIFGIILCSYLIIWCGFNRQYRKIKEKLCKFKGIKILWKIYNICVVIFTLYLVVVSVFMITSSTIKPKENATAIVLGAKVNPNGASVILKQRIDAVENYLNENPSTYAVVTGGQGPDEPISEAQCMKENLLNNNINDGRVLIEDKATNTYENIKYSYKIIQDNNLEKSLAITTDSYHQFRARLIARKMGIKSEIGAINSNTMSSKIATICYPTYFVREWFAIPVEILK